MEAFDLWRASTRRYHERRREEHRSEWIRHFDRMAESHAQIAEDYRRRAEELAETPTPARVKGGAE